MIILLISYNQYTNIVVISTVIQATRDTQTRFQLWHWLVTCKSFIYCLKMCGIKIHYLKKMGRMLLVKVPRVGSCFNEDL